MSNPFSDVVGFFEGIYKGTWNIGGDVSNAVTGWLKSAAGGIATALETGFLAIFKDLWDVVIGPLEVILGAVIIILALVFAFKDDIMQASLAFGLLRLCLLTFHSVDNSELYILSAKDRRTLRLSVAVTNSGYITLVIAALLMHGIVFRHRIRLQTYKLVCLQFCVIELSYSMLGLFL